MSSPSSAQVTAARSNIMPRVNLTKHRCIYSEFFAASGVREAYMQLLIEQKGLTFAQADIFMRNHRAYLAISDSVSESIQRNIEWCFDRDIFIPHRYNSETYGAYYTGKEVETAEAEFFYHYFQSSAPNGAKYTVFSVAITGMLCDLRRVTEIRASITDSGDYSFCQSIAEQLRRECDGLAVPSVRNVAGNCCPIFNRTAITIGVWVKEADLPVAVRAVPASLSAQAERSVVG